MSRQALHTAIATCAGGAASAMGVVVLVSFASLLAVAEHYELSRFLVPNAQRPAGLFLFLLFVGGLSVAWCIAFSVVGMALGRLNHLDAFLCKRLRRSFLLIAVVVGIPKLVTDMVTGCLVFSDINSPGVIFWTGVFLRFVPAGVCWIVISCCLSGIFRKDIADPTEINLSPWVWGLFFLAYGCAACWSQLLWMPQLLNVHGGIPSTGWTRLMELMLGVLCFSEGFWLAHLLSFAILGESICVALQVAPRADKQRAKLVCHS